MLVRNRLRRPEGRMLDQPRRGPHEHASLQLLFPGLHPGLAVLQAQELPLVLSSRKRVKEHRRHSLPVAEHPRLDPLSDRLPNLGPHHPPMAASLGRPPRALARGTNS